MRRRVTSGLRKDYIQDKYVIIAPHRAARPHAAGDVNYEPRALRGRRPPADCVFCRRHLNLRRATMVVGGASSWEMVVLPNKFPAVSLDNPRAYGVQEVVVETPEHGLQLEDFPVARIRQLLEVYAVRTRQLAANPKIEYVLIFKNNGGRAGASIQHAHSQVFATGFLPPHLLDKSQRAQAYKLRTGRCVYCDVIRTEQRGPRLVYRDQLVVAFCPYASLYNYELWIMPRRHLDNVTNLTPQEQQALASVLKRSVSKITHQLKLPYNYYFHQVVHDEDQHLYIKLTPRGSVWAGVEIGSGVVINPVSPEEAAAFYRRR